MAFIELTLDVLEPGVVQCLESPRQLGLFAQVVLLFGFGIAEVAEERCLVLVTYQFPVAFPDRPETLPLPVHHLVI